MAWPRRGRDGGEHHTGQGTPHQERTQMGDHLGDDTPDWAPRNQARGTRLQSMPVLGGHHGLPCSACAFLGEPCAFHQADA